MKIVKEVIRKKERDTFDSIPKKSIIDQVEIADTKTSNKTFNNLFVNSGPNLASKTPKSDTNFEAYISKANTKLQENSLMDYFRF